MPTSTHDQAASCIRCGHCVAVCPESAVHHAHLDPADFPPVPETQDFQAVLGLLRSRRSQRCYDPRPVPEGAVSRLLQAARYAPTGHNACQVACASVLSQEGVSRLRNEIVAFYRKIFALVERPIGRLALRLVVGPGRLAELQGALPGMRKVEQRFAGGEDPLFHGAPAVLVFHAPSRRETSESDCAIAAGQVSLLAPTLGLGTCHIGYATAALRRLPRVARRSGVPNGRTAYAVLAVGYPSLGYASLPPRPTFEMTAG